MHGVLVFSLLSVLLVSARDTSPLFFILLQHRNLDSFILLYQSAKESRLILYLWAQKDYNTAPRRMGYSGRIRLPKNAVPKLPLMGQ